MYRVRIWIQGAHLDRPPRNDFLCHFLGRFLGKGQLILKCIFDVVTFFQKMNEVKTKSTSSKANLFVCFLEETLA